MIPARLRRIFDSFWAMPALTGLVAVVLAEALLLIDRARGGKSSGVFFFADLSADGSRALLTTIAGTMLGVAATSFSITVSVLATTSSTYGPRLVRNFMADRGNQAVLAVLTSSFVYCLIVLRAVRSDTEGITTFVPTVAAHVAVLIALVDVGVLVYFIHHIASSVQVTTLQQRVARELSAAVDLVRPAEDREESTRDLPRLAERERWSPVRAVQTGYVTQVRVDSLVEKAGGADVVVEVLAMPGSHVVPGEVLARVSSPPDDELCSKVCAAFEVGPSRTPYQDVPYAVQQLVEMAVRALSPGTNDPYTAVGALDTLGESLREICSRPEPAAGHLDGDGRLRVVLMHETSADLVRPTFAAMRSYGGEHPLVVQAVSRLAERLLDVVDPSAHPGLDDVVREELGGLLDVHGQSGVHPLDVQPAPVRQG